jgi:hypothetical protein
MQDNQEKTNIFDQRNTDRTVDAMTGQHELFGTTVPKSPIVLSETFALPPPREKEDRILGASINEEYIPRGGIKSKKSKKTKKI